MKVSKVQIPSFIKNVALTVPLLLATNSIKAQNNNLEKDVFEKSKKIRTVDKNTFSPAVKIDGKAIYPALVVDISDKTLYAYDHDAVLIDSYPVRLCKDDLETGINTIEISEHNYRRGLPTTKITLTKINRTNGKVVDTHQQVIAGSENEKAKDDWGLFTNVVLVDRDAINKIKNSLTNDQFVLIRK
ncbi:MAG: hypothetical protein E7Z92_07240 [Cyanobacteria bacterium SIG31]|nr:hypothetical protein [Cyanobacteria bacterium SIG31]